MCRVYRREEMKKDTLCFSVESLVVPFVSHVVTGTQEHLQSHVLTRLSLFSVLSLQVNPVCCKEKL